MTTYEACGVTCPCEELCPTGEAKAQDAYEHVNDPGEPLGWEP